MDVQKRGICRSIKLFQVRTCPYSVVFSVALDALVPWLVLCE